MAYIAAIDTAGGIVRVAGRFDSHNAAHAAARRMAHSMLIPASAYQTIAARVLTWRDVALIGLAVVSVLAPFAVFAATSDTGPAVRIEVTTSAGDTFIAGEGDTCREAWEGARIPADWREIACVEND